jgi:hypothetical protein
MPPRVPKCNIVSFRLSAAEYEFALGLCERLGHASVPLLARCALLQMEATEPCDRSDAELIRRSLDLLDALTGYLRQYLAIATQKTVGPATNTATVADDDELTAASSLEGQ